MRRLGLAAGLLLALTGDVAAQSPDQLGCTLEPGPSRAVARVIDGSTLELDDKVVVRLIGILPPRTEDVGARAGTWTPEEAARTALSDLAAGRTVALAFSGPRRDRHGRIQAHLFLQDGERQIWLQGRLAETGHARVFAAPGAGACVEALLEREAMARAAGRGLWSNAAYHVRPADRPSELMRYRGTFQIVSGRVRTVTGARQMLILELGSAETSVRGLRVLVPRAGDLVRRLGSMRQLAETDVLVRGWIEGGPGGPEIPILEHGQLVRDVLEPGAETQKRPAGQPPGVLKP